MAQLVHLSAGSGPQKPRRTLVITADDFGISPAVNAGIVETIERGPVRSVSTLVTLPAFDDAVDRVRGFGAAVGVGLHFDLLIGPPLTPARSLVHSATGTFYPFRTLIVRALTGRIVADDVRAECAAQLERLARALDRAGLGPLSHMDSHRHVHVLPGIHAAVAAAAHARGVSYLPVPHVRVPREPWHYNPLDVSATAKKALLAIMTRQVDASDHFAGISLQGGAHFEARLLALLDNLPEGLTEIMVHPGFTDPGLGAIDSYIWQRDVERRALTSDAVRERMGRGDIALARFGG